ncbi:MAG: hypothetical protein GQ574_09790 [Crocinitomix sp.]|nr:hypothetical protein [Crocinitomix sp.]
MKKVKSIALIKNINQSLILTSTDKVKGRGSNPEVTKELYRAKKILLGYTATDDLWE